MASCGGWSLCRERPASDPIRIADRLSTSPPSRVVSVLIAPGGGGDLQFDGCKPFIGKIPRTKFSTQNSLTIALTTPEQKARANIDHLLEQAGWAVQDPDAVNLYATMGVAVRELSLKPGHGTADYLLFVNQTAVGVVKAKREGSTLVGVEIQSDKYSTGLPDALPSYRKPLPFLFESTGTVTQFTNLLDPEPRSRTVFGFHTPRPRP